MGEGVRVGSIATTRLTRRRAEVLGYGGAPIGGAAAVLPDHVAVVFTCCST